MQTFPDAAGAQVCGNMIGLMRKFASICVLLLFCWSLVVPAVAAQQIPRMKACCRSGAHHCSQTKTSDGFRSAGQTCPMRCSDSAAPAGSLYFQHAPEMLTSSLVEHGVAHVPEAKFVASHQRASDPSRGPPAVAL